MRRSRLRRSRSWCRPSPRCRRNSTRDRKTASPAIASRFPFKINDNMIPHTIRDSRTESEVDEYRLDLVITIGRGRGRPIYIGRKTAADSVK